MRGKVSLPSTQEGTRFGSIGNERFPISHSRVAMNSAFWFSLDWPQFASDALTHSTSSVCFDIRSVSGDGVSDGERKLGQFDARSLIKEAVRSFHNVGVEGDHTCDGFPKRDGNICSSIHNLSWSWRPTIPPLDTSSYTQCRSFFHVHVRLW